MHFSLKIWRQAAPRAKGYFEHYAIDQVDGDTSFLEMLDMLNNKLVKENKETIAFDHDCREGICGAWWFMATQLNDLTGRMMA